MLERIAHFDRVLSIPGGSMLLCGSSGVGLLRQRIAALVPNARKVEGDLFGSIGAGLAIDAARKFG